MPNRSKAPVKKKSAAKTSRPSVVSMRDIKAFGRRVGETFNVERVILFGSYATGRPREDSDVDIFVIMPFKGHWVNQTVAIRMQIRPKFPMDLLVRTPEAVRASLAMGDHFVKDIVEKGRVLYDANN